MHTELRRPSKAFGWGNPETHFYSFQDEPVKTWISEKFGLEPGQKTVKERSLARVSIADSAISPEMTERFQNLIGSDYVLTDKESRAFFSSGRSYRDLIRMRSMTIQDAPDIVLRPKTSSELESIMALANKHKIALIPFAGGSSVVGGLDPITGKQRLTAAVDITRINQIEAFQEESQLITVGAGIFGPELESWLNKKGYTLGHFPQSFEFSTVGGWISARSSGQNSIKYGSFDKIVTGLTLVSPQGSLKTISVPNMACGPDLRQLIIGSEGTFGFVTSCTLKVRPSPDVKKYTMYLFQNFSDARLAARLITQSESRPAMIRVSDEEESETLMALRDRNPKSSGTIVKQVAKWWIEKKGFDLKKTSLLLLGFEGSTLDTKHQERLAMNAIESLTFQSLGSGSGQQWLKDRFFLPYARDTFMDAGLLVDTFETVTHWHLVDDLYQHIKKQVSGVCEARNIPYSIFCHLSHLYSTGTSLYFTIICQETDDALEQWTEIKTAASKAVIEAGGPISHHHGVGTDHKPWLTHSQLEKNLLGQIKSTFDPEGIMNPGKLL